MKYGFIGCGNMASAIINGFNNQQDIEIFVFDINKDRMDVVKKNDRVTLCKSNEAVIENSDYLVLAVKPSVFPVLLPQLSPFIQKKGLLTISIAAGLTLGKITELLGANLPIIRVMPNINAQIGWSTSALCANSFVSDQQVEIVKNAFDTIGATFLVAENQFSIFTAIAGCSPAYTFLYIESLAKAALKSGMNKKAALEIAASSVLGSAKMLCESDLHPWELIDRVCSPGGTTIEGLNSLETDAFQASIVRAIDAAMNKDMQMGK